MITKNEMYSNMACCMQVELSIQWWSKVKWFSSQLSYFSKFLTIYSFLLLFMVASGKHFPPRRTMLSRWQPAARGVLVAVTGLTCRGNCSEMNFLAIAQPWGSAQVSVLGFGKAYTQMRRSPSHDSSCFHPL